MMIITISVVGKVIIKIYLEIRLKIIYNKKVK
jgi:hypothetical protein